MRQSLATAIAANPTTGTCTHRALPDCALRLPRHPILRVETMNPAPPPITAATSSASPVPDLQCRLWRPGPNGGRLQNPGLRLPRRRQRRAQHARAHGNQDLRRLPRHPGQPGLPMARRSCSTSPHPAGVPLWPQLRPHGDCAALGQGKLAAVANVGPLAPTTRAQVLAGSGSLPSNLYSHSDQILQAQAGNATGSGGTGWSRAHGRRPGGPQRQLALPGRHLHARQMRSSAPAPRWPRPA